MITDGNGLVVIPVPTLGITFRQLAEWCAAVGDPIGEADASTLDRVGHYYLVEARLKPETAVLFRLYHGI